MEKKQSRSALGAVLSIFSRPSAKTPGGSEEFAAIALALHLYSCEEGRRVQPATATGRAARAASPWGAKVHGLRQLPNKKGRNERL